MKAYVYGAGVMGGHVVERMDVYGESVEGFIDSYKMGTYMGYPIVKLSEVDKEAKVVISVLNTNSILEIYGELRRAGIKNIFWFYDIILCKTEICSENFWEKECLNLSDWGNDIMPHIELHISDKCNLNCRGCTHFSPLFDEIDAVLEKKLNDIKQLKKLFPDIFRIDILGGEPLLNPELKEYVIELRKELPRSFIQIYTNGLLIPKLSEEVLKTIFDNKIFMSISEYYPTHKMIDSIKACLDNNKISYRIAEYDDKQRFNTPISLSNNSKYPKMCISDGCITISDGMIARCPTLMYIGKFNDYFEQNLPTDGIHRIDEYDDGVKLLDDMRKAVPLCKHCVECDMEWSVCGKEKTIHDFSVND